MSTSIDEAAQLAVNLARNAGYLVFPCLENERPACPHGLKSASSDPATIARLWWDWPGPLIEVRTGADASGVSVLDVDQKHAEAAAWWRHSHRLLLPTRTFRTRSGGLHFRFRHLDGVKTSQGKIAPGIDTRGEGGLRRRLVCNRPRMPGPIAASAMVVAMVACGIDATAIA